MTITAVPEQKRAHFTWDMSSSFYGARPCRTQGYPLSPREIITLRRGDKSTEPGPYSPSTTANQFIGILTIRAHGCCHTEVSFFFFVMDLLSVHNWLFSTFVSLKYAWQLPRCCPLLHHMHWYMAYLNSVMSIKTFTLLMSPGATGIFTAKFHISFFFFSLPLY